MKIAIYARYSTENQNEKSVEDQIASCKEFISKEFPGSHEIRLFSDHAKSGRQNDRQGFKQLIEVINNEEIELIIAEGLDRLTRQLSTLSSFYENATFHNVSIRTIQEGDVSELSVGFKGTMNELYISSNRTQTIRAQRERAKEGKVFGSSYGYRVKTVDGVVIKGERAIHKKEARIIQKVFDDFISGKNLTEIVADLNKKGIPSPQGKKWGKSSILGSFTRSEGILNKEIYRGVVYFGKRSIRYNPSTGEKRHITNPRSEWIKTEIPELRIVSDETWFKCQDEIAKRHVIRGKQRVPRQESNQAAKLFSGLIFCECGARKHLANKGRYVCSEARTTGECKNLRGMRADAIYKKSINSLIEKLHQFSPEEFYEMLNKQFLQEMSDRQSLSQELAEKKNCVQNLLSAISTSQPSAVNMLTDKLNEEIQRVEEIESILSNLITEIPKNAHHHTTVELIALMKELNEIEDTKELYKKIIILTEKITAKPIWEKRFGETIEVTTNEQNWIKFYRQYVHPNEKTN